MPDEFETGFMVRQPSWHRKERAVLASSPTTWEAARTEAGLTWDVYTEPIYTKQPGVDPADIGMPPSFPIAPAYAMVKSWQIIKRDDTLTALAVQPTSYRVVRNDEFGNVIDALLGIQDDDRPIFEALFSLYEGRMIVALCYFESPLVMPWDPSKNYRYLAFCSRHDGNGGLRGIPTNVRVVCANTIKQAEMVDGRSVGFTIRHTANWKERIAEVRTNLVLAQQDSARWVEFAEQLALWKVGGRQREAYLKRFLPVSDDMGPKQSENRLLDRERIRSILASDTCAEIADTGYGLLMASTEWSDHTRAHHSTDSYISRQLLTKEPHKTTAAKVLAAMSGAKV